MLKKLSTPMLICLTIAICYCNTSLAGPPFITDDPDTVKYKHWEIYLFSQTEQTQHNLEIEIPALELDYGLTPHLEGSIIFPVLYNRPRNHHEHTEDIQGEDQEENSEEVAEEEENEPITYGVGDLELELKLALNEEEKSFPQVAIEPTYMLPLGDEDRGLGNGRGWWELPIWIGKTWDKWEVYGGGGYAMNGAEGERNFSFGGIATEYDMTDKLTVGGEIYSQGASADDNQSFALVNLGATYNFTKQVALLFSIGHSFTGEEQFVSYLALGFYL